MKGLALIQVSSYGAALEAANSASLRSSLEILELIPFGTFTQILLQGPADELNSYRKNLRTADLQKSVILKNPDPRILKAYYHLENQPIQKFILALECDFAGFLLEWAQVLLKKGLEVTDFRQPRLPHSNAWLLMTGEDLQAVQMDMLQMEAQKIKVSFVEEPSPAIKKYFQIEA